MINLPELAVKVGTAAVVLPRPISYSRNRELCAHNGNTSLVDIHMMPSNVHNHGIDMGTVPPCFDDQMEMYLTGLVLAVPEVPFAGA